jgi:RNA polymerase sigma-70 factor (ECF subfamily)
MTMAMPLADEFEAEELVIEAIRSGDRYAFEEFVRRRNRWVRGVIFGVLGNRECVDDVSQQVWSAVWQRIGELRESRSWRPWLYRLARNAAIDAGREITRRRNVVHPLAVDLPERAGSPGPDGEAGRKELHDGVLAAIQALPAIYREPFVLRHVNGWTYREIGEVMGLPIDSVETRLVRARRFLRESLRDRIG